MVAGAGLRGTYGVMMREWAEMVMRVQTGEVSGVGLHINETFSESGVRFHAAHVLCEPAPPSHPQTCAFVSLIPEPLTRCHLAASGPGPAAASKMSLAL